MTDCPSCDVEHARGSVECPGRRVGSVFHDKYELVRVLGCGGMGAVYEAIHVQLKRRCAVKVMLSSALAFESAAMRFEHEARRVAALEHPGIVKIFDAGRDAKGTLFIEMELLAGQSLEAWARTRPSPAACVEVIASALAALTEAHAHGIIHRDIKPENIFLAQQRDGSQRVVLLDFGIARDVTNETNRTQQGAVIGTLSYMSPEQLADSSSVDARADVFAMGATLYRLLVGQPPLDGGRNAVIAGLATGTYPTSVRASGIEVTPQLERAIATALSPEPDRRPRDAAAFRAMLVAAPGPAATELEADAHVAPRRAPAATELEDAPRVAPAGGVAPTEAADARPPRSAQDAVAAKSESSVAVATAKSESSRTAPEAVATAKSSLSPSRKSRAPWIAGLAVVAAGVTVPLVMHFRADTPPAVPADAAPAAIAHVPDAKPTPPPPNPPKPEQARITGGTVELGVADVAAFLAWCVGLEHDAKYCDGLAAPTHIAEVKTFDLDRREVTRADFAKWANDAIESGAAVMIGPKLVRATDKRELAQPACELVNGLTMTRAGIRVTGAPDGAVACITYEAAADYCAARGARLPTSAEWVLAARHRTGDPLRSFTCAQAVFGRVADGACKTLHEGAERVSLDDEDVTLDGVHALGGNVSEWIDAPAQDGKHLARGGSWAGGAVDLHPVKLMWVGAGGRGFAGATTIGFRCARSLL